jgi:hypothetical protein
MKRHTNLDHEIQGDYYEPETDWLSIILTSVCIGALIVVIAEFTGLTDWFIGLWM